MKKNPAISVVMPAYNAADYISEAITSILEQSFSDWELLIIDDASTDKTLEIAKTYASKDGRIHIHANKTNQKICATLNTGIQLARGKYIARMDADDWCYPNRLALQYAYLENHADIVVVGGALELCDAKLTPYSVRCYATDDAAIRKSIFRYSPFAHAATMYNRQAAIEAGLYNPSLFDAEDYDFFFRIGRLGKFGNIKDTIYRYRINKRSVSQRRARRQEFLTIYIRSKAYIEYGYVPTKADRLYSYAQLISFFVIPQRLKILLYQWFRDKRIRRK